MLHKCWSHLKTCTFGDRSVIHATVLMVCLGSEILLDPKVILLGYIKKALLMHQMLKLFDVYLLLSIWLKQ